MVNKPQNRRSTTMAGQNEQDKLDLILQKMDALTADVKSVKDQLSSVQSELNTVKQQVGAIEANVDHKIDNLKGVLTGYIDEEIAYSMGATKKEVKDSLGDDIESLQTELGNIQTELKDTKDELSNISSIVNAPFNPDRSVVVYGLVSPEGEALQVTVDWLIGTVLGVSAKTRNIDRTKARDDNRPGVVKIELESI